MSLTATKIESSSANYEERGSRSIQNIVIGMTNLTFSGYAYAKKYKSTLEPKISYNYVIDKAGKIYETIDPQYAPFTINASNDIVRTDNQELVSICFMPEWSGGGMYDDYEYGTQLPTSDLENGRLFLLTKIVNKGSKSYPTGVYEVKDGEWELVEAVNINEIKRPYKSDSWSITDDTYKSLLKLTKYLSTKKDIPVSPLHIRRVYDYYKTYNPAPFIDGSSNSGSWEQFLSDLEETEFEVITVTPETQEVITEEDNNKTEELIEEYGENAGENKETKFEGDSIFSATAMPGNKFTFELGIHDTLSTVADSANPTKANIVGNLWHIASVTKSVEWSSHLQDSCDELRFEFYNKDFQLDIKEGWNVGYYINGYAGFNGNVFKLSQEGKNKEMISVTCYGYMRYLQNEGWNLFENKTASQIFDEVCTILNIPHKVVDASTYICKKTNCFGKTYYNMIQQAIMETMTFSKEWYIIQPNFGTLEFKKILNQDNIQQIKFSEESAIIDWSFDSDINSSANAIITYKSGSTDSTTGKTEATLTGNASDSTSIAEWGYLLKLIQEDSTENAMTIKASDWLTYYNSPRRTIKLTCLGIPGVIAGNIIYLEIDNLVSAGNFQGCLVVDDCTHKIESDKHTMELTCEIVQDGTLRAQIQNALEKKVKGTLEETKTTETLESNTTEKETLLSDNLAIITDIINKCSSGDKNEAIYSCVKYGELNVNMIIPLAMNLDYTQLLNVLNQEQTVYNDALAYIKTAYGKDITHETLLARLLEINTIYCFIHFTLQSTHEESEKVAQEITDEQKEKVSGELLKSDKADYKKTLVATKSEIETLDTATKSEIAKGELETIEIQEKEASSAEEFEEYLKTNYKTFCGYEVKNVLIYGLEDNTPIYHMYININGNLVDIPFTNKSGKEKVEYLTKEDDSGRKRHVYTYEGITVVEKHFKEFIRRVKYAKLNFDNELVYNSNLAQTAKEYENTTYTTSYTLTYDDSISHNTTNAKIPAKWSIYNKGMTIKDCFMFIPYKEITYVACDAFAHKVLYDKFQKKFPLLHDETGDDDIKLSAFMIGDGITFDGGSTGTAGHIEIIYDIVGDYYKVVGGNQTINGASGVNYTATRPKKYYESANLHGFVSHRHIPFEL